MRFLLAVLVLLSQAACTAMLVGGGQSGQYPDQQEAGQGNAECDEKSQKDQCT
ncbi:MAG: hypothetical protein ACE5FV_08340 [Woeseia sp.]